MVRGCGTWNTSIISLPSSGHICFQMDMTITAATRLAPGTTGTLCVCVTDYCNSLEMVFGSPIDSTTQASADITTQTSAGTTKGAEGGADQAMMSLYLLCVTGLALFY